MCVPGFPPEFPIPRSPRGARSPRIEYLEDRRMLATMTVSVNWDGDIAEGDGKLTLREAIAL